MGVEEPKSGDGDFIRWLALAVALMLAAVQVLIWAWLALESVIVLFPTEPPPPASAGTGPFSFLLLLNVVALLAFSLRHRGFGFWLLLVVQAGDVIALLRVRMLNLFTDEFVSTALLVACAASAVSVALLLFARYTSTPRRA